MHTQHTAQLLFTVTEANIGYTQTTYILGASIYHCKIKLITPNVLSFFEKGSTCWSSPVSTFRKVQWHHHMTLGYQPFRLLKACHVTENIFQRSSNRNSWISHDVPQCIPSHEGFVLLLWCHLVAVYKTVRLWFPQHSTLHCRRLIHVHPVILLQFMTSFITKKYFALFYVQT